MAVLYFLSHVLAGTGKRGQKETGIDTFILSVVSRLDVCETFPWGRYTFYDVLEKMESMVEKFDGGVVWQTGGALPSFIMPLEILAFEAIPCLGREFRKPFGRPDAECPRMCKTTFKPSAMRGFSIKQINEALGDTKDITSIIQPSGEEQHLLYGVVVDDDVVDPVVDGWMDRLHNGQTVFFEDLYKQDIEARNKEEVIDVRKRKRKTTVKDTVQHEEAVEKENTGLGDEGAGPSGTAWEERLEARLEEAIVGRLIGRMEVMLNDLSGTLNQRIDHLELKVDALKERLDDFIFLQTGEVRSEKLPHVLYATYDDLPIHARVALGDVRVDYGGVTVGYGGPLVGQGDGVDLLAKVATDHIEEDVEADREGEEENGENPGDGETGEKAETEVEISEKQSASQELEKGAVGEEQADIGQVETGAKEQVETVAEEQAKTGAEEPVQTGADEQPEAGAKEQAETGAEEQPEGSLEEQPEGSLEEQPEAGAKEQAKKQKHKTYSELRRPPFEAKQLRSRTAKAD